MLYMGWIVWYGKELSIKMLKKKRLGRVVTPEQWSLVGAGLGPVPRHEMQGTPGLFLPWWYLWLENLADHPALLGARLQNVAPWRGSLMWGADFGPCSVSGVGSTVLENSDSNQPPPHDSEIQTIPQCAHHQLWSILSSTSGCRRAPRQADQTGNQKTRVQVWAALMLVLCSWVYRGRWHLILPARLRGKGNSMAELQRS